MEKGDVVTVVTVSGEYVGIFEEKEGDQITLKKPRMLVQTEGGMGFANGIAVSGESEPEQVTFLQAVYVIPTNEKVAKAHTEHTTSIQLVK